MENDVGNIPLFADKLLFAEDLVNYAMNDIFDIPYEVKNAERYRPFIYSAFNETIKQAVTRLFSQTEMTMFRFLFGPDELRAWDGSTYLQIAKRMYDLRLSEGFEAKSFLAYCVELTILAKKFRNNGLHQAPDQAVYLIFVSLKEYDMFLGGWETLNNVASSYLSAFVQCENCLTPDSFASAISDNELQNLISQSSSSDTNSSRSASQKTDTDDPSSEESRGYLEMLVDSPAGSLTYSEYGSSENNLSPYVPEEDEYMNSCDTIQSRNKESEAGSANEPELRVVSTEGVATANEKSEPENLEFPCSSVKDKSLQSSLKFQRTTVSNEDGTNRETETLAVENTSVLTPKPNLDSEVSTKESNVQLTDIFRSFEVRHVAKNNSSSLPSRDGSKASTSCQSPHSFSSSVSNGEGINPDHVSEIDLETVDDTQESRKNKRFLGCDCKSDSEKRLKLSQSTITVPGDERDAV